MEGPRKDYPLAVDLLVADNVLAQFNHVCPEPGAMQAVLDVNGLVQMGFLDSLVVVDERLSEL